MTMLLRSSVFSSIMLVSYYHLHHLVATQFLMRSIHSLRPQLASDFRTSRRRYMESSHA